MESEVVPYIGIATDEGARTDKHIEKVKQGLERLPLVEAGWTEQMCRDWCEQNDLLSPIYTDAARGGCWFCHNQRIDQFRLLRKNYPDLWAILMKWDDDSPVIFRRDGRTVHDIERRFKWEDDGYRPTGKTFRWADTEAAQMNIDQWIGMRDVRDCEHCENYVAWDDRPEIKSCRKWACEYEPLPEPYKEGNDEQMD